MMQGTIHRNMGKTGGIVKLDIAPQDAIPETQELDNREGFLNKTQGYPKAVANPEAPNYVENIITSKFYPVAKPPAMEKTDKEPEYETAEAISEAEMFNYLDSLEGLKAKVLLFLSGIIAGIGLLHFYVLYFSDSALDFLNMYARIAKGAESIFHMFVYLSAIFCLILMLINFSNYQKASSNLSTRAGAYMLHFIFYSIAFASIFDGLINAL